MLNNADKWSPFVWEAQSIHWLTRLCPLMGLSTSSAKQLQLPANGTTNIYRFRLHEIENLPAVCLLNEICLLGKIEERKNSFSEIQIPQEIQLVLVE